MINFEIRNIRKIEITENLITNKRNIKKNNLLLPLKFLCLPFKFQCLLYLEKKGKDRDRDLLSTITDAIKIVMKGNSGIPFHGSPE
jgi:hypothetical protein